MSDETPDPVLGISHATCPAKRDIVPPNFAYVETLHTSKGRLVTYRCEGCADEIRVMFPARAEP